MFDWVTHAMQQSGYIGIVLLMFAENLFPPIPSEVIMPLAGFTAARGEFNIYLVVLAGTLGSVLGALFWYFVGRWLGCERIKRQAVRHGRWLTVSPEEVDNAAAWFRRHCGKAVFLGRLVPTVRTLISVPAGIAGMDLGLFLLYSTLGTVIWTTLLAVAGYLLESQYQQVATYLNPVANIIFVLIVLWYLYRVVTFRPRRPRPAP